MTLVGPRIMNIMLGIWLFLSAFLWTHSGAQFNNAWLVGALIAGFASIALAVPQFSYLNVVLALWLFVSAIILPASSTVTTLNPRWSALPSLPSHSAGCSTFRRA
jgi:hypothetical protein